MPIVGQFGSLAGLGSLILPGGAMESIATVTVGSGGASSIEFTSIPGGFQHLQVRLIARTNRSTAAEDALGLRFNGDTGATKYAIHVLSGNGSSASASASASVNLTVGAIATGNTATSSNFGCAVIDILDYANTSKTTVVRAFTGYDDGPLTVGKAEVRSGLWNDTSAVTSITLASTIASSYLQHSTAALYGLRAP